MKKSKKVKKKTSRKGMGCLSYIWIICIVVGVVISMIKNDTFYLFISIVAPPSLYLALKYGTWGDD